MKSRMSFGVRAGVLFCLVLVWAGSAQAGLLKLAIVHADVASSASGLQTALEGTGLFSSVDLFDATDAGVPTLNDIKSYDRVLVYTNFSPDDATSLGDVLADYVDLDPAHGVVIATYGGSATFGIAGRITDTGYSPFTIPGPDGDPSGALVPTAGNESDPVFAGVDLNTLTYYHDGNFANPSLDADATLIATDGAGINMIARNKTGNVLGLNLFPGTGVDGNSESLYTLLGNALVDAGELPAAAAVPEPATVLFAAQAFVVAAGIGVVRRRRATRRD